MVLRSGIIIPFQFRDSKKLLMIGGMEEERDVSIWDLKNVVRAAFGIYNFEFRNKQIGFNIPEELLLHYLAQCRDLTNFVIEIGQANASDIAEMTAPLRPNDINNSSGSSNSDMHLHLQQPPPLPLPLPQAMSYANDGAVSRLQSPLLQHADLASAQDDAELPHKIRLPPSHMYSGGGDGSETPSDMTTHTQLINPMVIIPKSEQDDAVADMKVEHELLLQHQQQHQQHQQQLQEHNHYYGNYQSASNQVAATSSSPLSHQQLQQHQQQQLPSPMQAAQQELTPPLQQSQPLPYTPNVASRFRMYDPYKDNHPDIAAGCSTCHCSTTTTSKPLDLHDANTTNSRAGGGGSDGGGLHLSVSHLERSHSNVSSNTMPSPHSHNALDDTSSLPPPLKLRATSSLHPPAGEDVEINEMEYEQKVVYEAAAAAMHLEHEILSRSPPPPARSQPPDETSYLHQQQHEQQQFERLQHEYFIQHHQQQQQQQHHHHQQQQHLDTFYQETTTNNLRQRKERMSKKQKEIYVNFLEQNPSINEHRRNDAILDPFWVKLADILNSVPQGAVKHVTEWKQTFDNWRYRVYLYARFNSKISGDATLNPKSFKPLTHTDKRAYAIWIRNPDTAPPDLEKMRNVFVNLDETLQE